MSSFRFLLSAIAAALLLNTCPAGAFTLHPLFSHGAVLQRGQSVPVWGTGERDERITISIQGKSVTAITSAEGKWRADLPALEVGGPFEMVIAGDLSQQTTRLKDIHVGEVWICSGQSNMDMVVASADRASEEIAAATNAAIHFCKVPRQAADEPQATAKLSWQTCTPQTVGNLSAVGYFFIRDLQARLQVPVGLIDAAYGGTPAEAWMSPEAVRSRPEFQPILDEYAEQVKDSPRAMAQYESEMTAWKIAAEQAQKAGQPRPPAPQIPMGPHNFRRPSGLYHGMIHPLVPYAFRGVIWYQGERNSPRAAQYRTLFPALIADWRHMWPQGDFPFLFVQLAPFGAPSPEPRASGWAELREAQLLTSQTVPRTAMAVITDVGDEKDIHPTRKQAVGARLALAARAVAYGEDVAFRGPTYRSLEIRENRAVLSFDHVGQGLECRGDRLTGFAICGADGKFVNADARIIGNQVEVSSPQIAQPVAIRYGWANFPVVNLWNKDGLPASPFRTDESH